MDVMLLSVRLEVMVPMMSPIKATFFQNSAAFMFI